MSAKKIMRGFNDWRPAPNETMGEFLGDSMSVPKLNFKKYRRENQDTWLCKDARILRIADMKTDHIVNCIELLLRNDQIGTKAYLGLTLELEWRMK